MTRTRQELVTLHEVVSACASGGCRQRKRLRALLWNSSGRYFSDLFAGGREVARAAQAQGFTVQAWDAIFDATRLNLCRSAVRARLKHDIKLANFRLFVLQPPSRAASFRAQRVALCLFSFSAKYKIPTASCATLCVLLVAIAYMSKYESLLRSQGYTEVHLDWCQFGHQMRRPTLVLLANVDRCDIEKLRHTFHGVYFACSHSGTTHRRTNDAIASRLPTEFCHSLVQTLMARSHAMFSYNQPTIKNPPMRTPHLGCQAAAGASLL